MSGLSFARSFSRPGQALLRLSQEDSTALPRGSDGLIFKAAVILSLCGMGFSMFSVSQLQDCKRSSTKMGIKKS